MVSVTPEDLRCDFRYVADVWDPDTEIARTDSWAIEAGAREPAPV